MADHGRLEKQLQFIREIDKLKQVGRQTLLMDGSRYENDAEHSWHLALMAIILVEYSNIEVDVCKVMRMVLLHDMVEIYAGDTFCYDVEGQKNRAERERLSAEKLFSMLPDDQSDIFLATWEEFEARKTPEAKFAGCLDRLQPLMHNLATKGAAWQKHGVTKEMVLDRNSYVQDGSKELWGQVLKIVEESVAEGYLPEG